MTLYPLGDTSARAEISMLTVLESSYNARPTIYRCMQNCRPSLIEIPVDRFELDIGLHTHTRNKVVGITNSQTNKFNKCANPNDQLFWMLRHPSLPSRRRPNNYSWKSMTSEPLSLSYR